MDLEQEFKKETGLKIEINNNLEPYIYNYKFVEWLKAKINYTRSSVQLLCIDKSDDNGITKGFEYKCIGENTKQYKIVDNYGYELWYLKEYFKKQ
jgi:hypothetical protein